MAQLIPARVGIASSVHVQLGASPHVIRWYMNSDYTVHKCLNIQTEPCYRNECGDPWTHQQSNNHARLKCSLPAVSTNSFTSGHNEDIEGRYTNTEGLRWWHGSRGPTLTADYFWFIRREVSPSIGPASIHFCYSNWRHFPQLSWIVTVAWGKYVGATTT